MRPNRSTWNHYILEDRCQSNYQTIASLNKHYSSLQLTSIRLRSTPVQVEDESCMRMLWRKENSYRLRLDNESTNMVGVEQNSSPPTRLMRHEALHYYARHPFAHTTQAYVGYIQISTNRNKASFDGIAHWIIPATQARVNERRIWVIPVQTSMPEIKSSV